MKKISKLPIILIFTSFFSFAGEWDEFSPNIDEEVKEVFAGKRLSQSEREEWKDNVMKHTLEVGKKYDLSEMPEVTEFNDEMVVDHYIFSLKMAVINPNYFGGWPFGHADTARVYGILKGKVSEDSNPAEVAAAILTSIRSNDIRFARSLYRKLIDKDKDWATYVTYYVFATLGASFAQGEGPEYSQEIKE